MRWFGGVRGTADRSDEMVEALGRKRWIVVGAVVVTGFVGGCATESTGRVEDSAPTVRGAAGVPGPLKIAFADGWQSVFVMNPDGSGVTRIATGSDPSFALDGSRIVVAGAGISTMDPDGGNITRVADGGYGPTFAPDGRTIAFARGGAIYLVDSTGENLRRLTDIPDPATVGPDLVSANSPSFARDGSAIVFVRAGIIWLMAGDGTGQRELLRDQFYNSGPKFTADGADIVFTSNRGGRDQSEIYTMKRDGTDIRALTTDGVGGLALSPDGRRILYTRMSRTQSNAEVWEMNLDGSNPHRLTDPNLVAQSPSMGGIGPS